MTGSTVAVPSGTAAQAEELLACARSLERELLAGASEVAQTAAAQGRPDPIEAVTGMSSLTKAAREVATIIAEIKARTGGQP